MRFRILRSTLGRKINEHLRTISHTPKSKFSIRQTFNSQKIPKVDKQSVIHWKQISIRPILNTQKKIIPKQVSIRQRLNLAPRRCRIH